MNDLIAAGYQNFAYFVTTTGILNLPATTVNSLPSSFIEHLSLAQKHELLNSPHMRNFSSSVMSILTNSSTNNQQGNNQDSRCLNLTYNNISCNQLTTSPPNTFQPNDLKNLNPSVVSTCLIVLGSSLLLNVYTMDQFSALFIAAVVKNKIKEV